MSMDAYLVLGILAAAVVFFSFDWIAPEITAVVVLVLLASTGILSPREALSGFSSEAVAAIAGLLVIGAGLVRTGAVRWMAERLSALAGNGIRGLLLISTAVPGLLSGFINIVAAVGIFIPAVLRLSRRSGQEPARLLLPMAASALLGANLSLIGASHNLVVNGLLRQETQESFGFFEFTPVGVVLVAGISLYSLLVSGPVFGKKAREASTAEQGGTDDLVGTYRLDERLWEVLVQPGSSVCCSVIEEIGLGRNYGLGVLMVLRRGRQLAVEGGDFGIRPNDVLALSGSRERVEAFTGDHTGLVLMGQPQARKDFTWSVFDLVEVAVPPHSRWIGRTLRDAGLRHESGLTGIGLWREGQPYRTDVGNRELRAGDGILLFGSRSHVEDFRPEPDLLWVRKPRPQEAPLHLRKLAPAAVAIFLSVILSAALGWVSIAVAALAGAAFMAVLGIMPPGLIYRKVDWRTLILIGGMYPVGTALEKSGAAAGLAHLVLHLVGGWGPVPALTAVGLLALLLTQPMHNAVAALIVTPVALQIAGSMGADPKAFALAVVVGASASFLLPVGHPAPLLVQEPGGYRSLDYLKFGAGAALFVLAVIAVVIPLLWPLSG